MAKYRIMPSSKAIIQLPISIGHKAEKGVEAIEFDLTAWVETYGSGTLTVIMRRWGDAIPYPIALEIDENNKATWTLSDTDTAKAGMAYAQLSYIVGDEVVKKSDIYTFRVMDSLTGEGEPPEAYESWLEHLTHFAAEAMAEVLDIEEIVTDKTLTVDGGIADAKATGDALALKADKSTTYTKTEVDKMIEDVEVETDTTLEIAGAPADAAETGRQIGLIKADLGDKVGVIGSIQDFYINLTTDPVDIANPSASSTGLAYSIIDCSEGDKFLVNAVGATSGRAWGFLDSGNHVLSMADANETVEDLELTAPTNAVKLIINDKGGGMSYKVGNNLATKVGNGLSNNLEPGLSDAVKAALLTCFRNVAWKNENGQDYYGAIEIALGMSTYPRIVAIFNPGANIIYTDDALDTLKQYMTVKYVPSQGASGTTISASEYTLSGTLSEGANALLVSYGNYKTAISVIAVDYYNITEWSTDDGMLTSLQGVYTDYFPILKVNTGSLSRGFVACNRGKKAIVDYKTGDSLQPARYPIPVPVGATGVTVTLPSDYAFGFTIIRLVNNEYQEGGYGSGWSEYGGGSNSFGKVGAAQENTFMGLRINGTQNISVIGPPNPVKVVFTFN